MIVRLSIAAMTALAVAACGNPPAEDTPEQEPTETAEPDTTQTEGASIIRDDVPIERELPPLEPLMQRISFGEGGSDLSEEAVEELETVLASRQMEAGGAIVLRGHTDSEGHDEANIRASQRRAEAVRDWLVEKGIAEERIRVIAMGEQNPARPNAKPDGTPDEAGRAYNRRVMLRIKLPPELEAQRTQQPQTLVEQVTAQE